MPALDNPRWERFAQAIVEGLANGDRKPYSQGRAYIAAGYLAKDAGKPAGSAEAAASRLLKKVKPILDRVRELQAELAAQTKETREKCVQEDACKPVGSDEAAASRLLKKVKPILDRVRELQAELAAQTKETREKCVQELNELKREAQAEKAYGPAVSAVMGKAKILNFITDQVDVKQQVDFNSAQSMSDIGRKLLQSIGFKEPDDVSIQAAVEANDRFIDELQQIQQRAQSLTLKQ